MRIIKKIISFAAACLLSAFLFAEPYTIFVVESEHPHDLNPHTTSYSSDAQILTGLYEGLFSYNPKTLDPQYALCISYRVSRDKKRMTFTLRQDAKFSNGEQITAHSVRDSWMRLLETPNAPYASMLDIIRGAQNYRLGKGLAEDVAIYVVDDFTLSVSLTAPANYFTKILCHSTFSVVHEDPDVFSGPYKIGLDIPGNILLLKNAYYWDYDNVKAAGINFTQSNNADENAFLYNTGLADWVAADISTDKIIDKNAIQMSAEFATSYFFFKKSDKKPSKKISDGSDFNPWDYEEFRNALLEAMPWDELRANSLVSAPTLVYPIGTYPSVDGFSYTDNIEALQLMKAARQKYGLLEEEVLSLVFDITEYSLTLEKQEAMKKAFEPLGVELKFRVVPSSLYFTSLAQSDSDMFIYTWIGDFADPLAFLMLFQSDSTLNDSGWTNEEFDSLIAQAAAVDDSSRLTLLAQAEKILLDSGMVVPIYHPIAFNVIDLTEIGGWSANAFDIHPLKYLYKKENKKTVPGVVLK